MQCHSLDTLGLMARTLDDIALFRGAVLKLCRRCAIDRGIPAPRVGFCRTPIWDEASADTKKLLEATASKLADKGAAMVDAAFAPAYNDILDDHGAISAWESARNYADERLRNPGKRGERWRAMNEAPRHHLRALCRRPTSRWPSAPMSISCSTRSMC